MKNLALWIGGLAILAGLTGCVENAVLVKLKKDGSGTVVYRLYVSEAMTGMMQGTPGADADLFAQIKAGLGEQLGGGATLQSSREIQNKKGWKGIEALFAFDDINQLKLHELDAMGGAGGGSDAGGPDESVGEDYTLQFTPGDVATLKLAPMIDADAAEAADASEEVDMSQMPLDMIKPMISGMRMSFLVAVEGEIVETNSKFRSSKQPSVITVMDVSMDRLLDHPEGAKLLQSGKSDDTGALAALQIPGVKIEEPGKEIVVRFK